jgi:hypothetical protein
MYRTFVKRSLEIKLGVTGSIILSTLASKAKSVVKIHLVSYCRNQIYT